MWTGPSNDVETTVQAGPPSQVDNNRVAVPTQLGGRPHWHNHDRPHGYLDDVTPPEFEKTLYATKKTDQTRVAL